ncbi:hypothetical protein IEQ34_023464 [Dendrobium chrysotoxum]|uniref:Uncharacterized protein n=1 Tax=Dendrobium chrysotoxum TaxID=161865 RepID=A0AAV7FJS4_DENCH|nr:hypothetical protein IEQ34_023464 [Dendrobium chrysotoxum]
MKGISCRGNHICFGRYALQALEPAWITARQIFLSTVKERRGAARESDRTPLLSVEWTGRRPKQSNKQERASDDKGCDFLIRENLPAEDLLERKQDDLKKSWVPARAETGQAGIELDDAFKG